MATIRLQAVTKSFGTVNALKDVNLTIPNGETIAVVGPSGSGKSTLLRVVAGLDTDYSGQIFYDDREMGQVPPKDRYIGMVFQNYALYPHFAGHGNLSFFFRVRKIDDQQAEERIRITSEIMGIGFNQLLQRKPGTLSGGQQQRLAIARAIVRNPRLFLFDEPLSNLDAKLRVQTRVEIKRLLHRFQITSLYVTHDQTEAIALGDQIAVMRAAKVEQVGPYMALIKEPVNAFVAGFLGAPPMNLFTGGRVTDGVLHFAEMSIPLPPRLQALVHSGQGLTLGVRPEAMRILGVEQPAPANTHLRGTVDVVEPDMGRRLQWVHVRTGSLTYTVVGALDQPVYIGNEVDVLLPSDQLYFFDGASETRLG